MCRAGVTNGRAAEGIELADIVRSSADDFSRSHRLCGVQLRALADIRNCRTAALGGQVHVCDTCGATRVLYRSCGNRHCPKCQLLARERWLQARRRDLLPIPYFHVVFTLPHELNVLAQCEPRLVYKILFAAAAQTLQVFGRDVRHLGGEIGVTAVLHTWGQNLGQHIHVHCLVTGGALAASRRWINARPGFLFPVRALSKLFRGKYLAMLTEEFEAGTCYVASVDDLLAKLRAKPWVVYAKPPFAGPEDVLAYLGRYTHRVAITNHRILAFDGEYVSFRWRDYADGDRQKVMRLATEEFLRRFLLHVLPKRFVRVRHFGLLASRNRTRKIEACRIALAAPEPEPVAPMSATAILIELTGVDPGLCQVCGTGTMLLQMRFAGARSLGTWPRAPTMAAGASC